jgi:hypothetical protein
LSQYIKIPNSSAGGYVLNAASRDAWSAWLCAEPWDLFWTQTDAGMSHPEHMTKRVRYLENCINESLYGKNFKRKNQGIETVWGIERQTRGSVHAHGLIRLPNHDAKDPNQFSLEYWKDFSSELGFKFDPKTGKRIPGGWSFIEVPKSQDDVARYVTGYVIKDGELIIVPNFNPNWPRTFSQTLFGVSHGKA